MEDKVYLGFITGTHGIKGELKIKSDFEQKVKVFKKGFKIYINNQEFTITSYRHHKDFEMVTIDDMYDINMVIKYVKNNVFINRCDLNLKADEYLVNDLIDFFVYDEEVLLGKVKEIRYNKVEKFLYVEGNKNFYIPYRCEFIKNVDIASKKIYTINGGDLII